MKINFKSVSLGWLSYYAGMWLVNKIVLAMFIVLALNGSRSPAKLRQVMAALRVSAPLHVIQLGTQIFFTVAAAYLVVRIAKRAPLENSLAFGIVCLASTIYFGLDTFLLWPIWYSVLTVLLNLPLALLGGFWGSQKIRVPFLERS